MKKNAFLYLPILVSSLLLVSCASAAGNAQARSGSVPPWMGELESVYPDSAFLASVGSGDSRRAAEDSASGSLARRFKVDITVDTKAQERYLEIVSKDKSYNETERSVAETVNSRANEQLLGLKYSDTYTDKAGAVWIVAYLERDATTTLYRSLINKDLSLVSQLKDRASKAPTNLISFALLDTAVQVSLNADRMIAQLQIIQASAARLLASQADTPSVIKLRDEAAQKLGYRLTITGDTDDKIGAMVRKTLAERKLNYRADGNLELKGTILIEPVEVNPRFKSVRWTLNLSLNDETGSTIANFFKESRENAISDAEARAFAVREMEKKISSEFLESFNEYLDQVSATK